MLASVRFRITEVSYPDFSLPILICLASVVSFLIGYSVVRIICWNSTNSRVTNFYQIDISRLRKFNFVLACSALSIIAFNLFTSGIPPFLAFFGFAAKSSYDYGRLKQLLIPILMALFVDAFLDCSRRRKIFYALFAFIWLMFYLARGGILLMLFQALIVLSIRTSLPKKKIYFVAAAGVGLAGAFFGILGSYRTSDAILMAGMHIKTEFWHWPTIYVWIISYLSAPLSNLCWYVRTAQFDHITWSFAYTLLPAFWYPPGVHNDISQTTNIVDGVSTYLANYFLDFSYVGIVLVNILIGMISGFASVANRISRKFLFWSVFLSCIGFMFFWDFFASLEMLILLGIQAHAHRYFLRELTPQTS